MKFKILILSLASFLTLSNAQAQKGKWVSLFDGKTTNGWHTYGKTTVSDLWKVTDETLTLDPTVKEGRGDIVTDESFDDFHLQLEWKISKNGNSGIIFFVQDNKDKFANTWFTGPEMQVLDNDGHPDGKITKHRAGNLYDLVAGVEGADKPVGEWNKVDIINKKGTLTLKLNGVTTVTTTVGDENWATLIKGSKFAKMNDFGKVVSGHIGLQDHGDAVSFRNIRIRRL